MITFTNPLFWLYAMYFLIVAFVAFYIPGNILIRKEKFTPFQTIVMSCVVGIVLWSLTGFIFGYLQLRILSYLYLIGMLLIWLKTTDVRLLLKKTFSFRSADRITAGILTLAVIVQVITVWFIGYQTKDGLEFCCFWPDSFYHLALINELVQTFPPIEPGLSNVAVRNYHFLANSVVADLVRVFTLPLIPTQYQYMPIFISLLLGGTLICIAQILHLGKVFTRWLLFFMFFSGDILFLLTLFLGQGFNLNITVSENATTLWFSPPRVYAMVILFGGIFFLVHYLKRRSVVSAIVLGIFFGSLVGFKIYLGFFALVGLCTVTLLQLTKKRFDFLIPLAIAGVIALMIYLPVNTQAGGLFYSGMWRVDNFAVRPELGLMRFTLAKQVYEQHQNFLRLFLIEGMYFLLYVVSLCGMFLIGLFQTKKSLQRFPLLLHIFLLSGLLASFIIGMFFLQNTGGANTLQFLFSVYIVGAFYAALSASYWTDQFKLPIKLIVIVIVIILVSFRVARETYANIADIRKHEGYYVVSKEELEGLQYLKNNVSENATIAVQHDIAMDDSCYIISVLSERNYFLCGNGILEDHGAETRSRVMANEVIFMNRDANIVAKEVHKNNIDYLYTQKNFIFGTTQVDDFMIPAFTNDSVVIYKIEPEKARKLLQ